MADQPKPAIKVPKHDTVATLFADGLFGASVSSGVARLELFADHFDPATSVMQPTIVGRLVMPAEKLEGFVRGVGELVQQLQNQKKPKPEASDTKTASGPTSTAG
jgi:hypothetical protein